MVNIARKNFSREGKMELGFTENRCLEPGHLERPSAAPEGTFLVSQKSALAAPSGASERERVPGDNQRFEVIAGGEDWGLGRSPNSSGVSGLETPACLRRNNSPQISKKPYPKSVQACLDEAWHLCLHHRETGEEKRIPYRCKSFRCPKCGDKVRRQDYIRISQGMAKRDTWIFLVLTLQRTDFRNHTHAYKVVCHSLQKLRQRMEREFGKLVYLRVVEQHTKAPYPHVNFVFNCPELFVKYPDDESLYEWLKRWLTSNARECGFGFIHSASYSRSEKAVAEYLSKAAIHSELSKSSQVPLDAPLHFRRIGASRGILPPRKEGKSEFTGKIVKIPLKDLPKSLLEIDDDELMIANSV